MCQTDNFYKELIEKSKIKISYEEIVQIYNITFPEYKNIVDKNQRIMEVLKELEKEEKLLFPKTKWNKIVVPHIPPYIKIPIKNDNKEKIIKLQQISWISKLSFANELKTLEQLESLSKINNFFIENQNNKLCTIPIRERSMQIFGDEKKLDRLHKKGKLFGDRLTLVELKCEDIPPPLHYEAVLEPNNKPILICENSNSFHSFRRWNKEKEIYSVVVYGSGNEFSKTHYWLEEIIERYNVSTILYFGDIDPIGLEIPFNINKTRISNQLTPIKPAKNLYNILLELNKINILKDSANKKINEEVFNWFDSNLMIKNMKDLFEKNLRIPQEALSYEDLITINKKRFI